MIVFIFLIPYTASVYNGLSRLFTMALGLESEFSYKMIIVAMAFITAIYVILGGYTATALNDFVQGIVMLIGIIAVVACVINGQGGLSEAVSRMADIETPTVAKGEFASLFGPDPINLIGVIILTSLGTWGLPQMVHKFYAIKDNDAIKKGTIISTIFALVVAGGSYLMGGFDRLYNTVPEGEAPVFDSMVPTMLEKALPDLLIGLVVVLVLSASMSTLSSLVLTSSSTLTIDFVKPKLKKENEKSEILIMRIFIAIFLLISVVIAFNKNASITTLMSYSWGALAGAFLGPFMIGLFSKKTTKAAVWTSFIIGIGLTVLHMFFLGFGLFPELKATVAGLCPLKLDSPINLGAIVMILSIIIVPVVSAFTKKPDAKYVENIFQCYTKED